MTDLFVGLGGFATIQDAIDAAEDGDHIVVSAGTYSAFTIDKSVSIQGDGDVQIVGSFRDDNQIPLNTSVADFLKEAGDYSPNAGAGITVLADGVSLSNLHISSFLSGVSFNGADDLVLENVDIKDTVIGVLKYGDCDSSGFRMWGGSISDSYQGLDFDTDDGGPPIVVLGAPEGAGAIIAPPPTSAFDDVIIDGVAFSNITFKGIYANALSNAQLLNLVMTDVGDYGEGPAFGPCWLTGTGAAGIDINIASGIFENIVISGFVLHNVGTGSDGDGAGITIRSDGDSKPADIVGGGEAAAPEFILPPPTGSVLIENGIVDGTAVAYRLGTDGGEDDIWSNVSVQNVLVNGYANATLDNQSYQTLVVGGTPGNDLLDAADTTNGQLAVYGAEGNDRIIGGWNDDTLDGGSGDDLIFTRGGVDTVNAGSGNDGVYFGRYFNQKGGSGDDSPPGGDSPPAGDGPPAAAPVFHFDSADGGDGIDTFALQGNYYFSILSHVTNFEVLFLASGMDANFDFLHGREPIDEDSGPPSIAPPVLDTHYFYNLIAPNSLVAPGTVFTVMANDLRLGETLIFNGSAEHDGAYRIYAGDGTNILIGGDGDDGFMYGGSPIGENDRIDGGDGTDTIGFRGNFVGGNRIVFQGDSFHNVENIALCSGHTNEYGGMVAPGGYDYDVTMADGNVAAGKQLGIMAGMLQSDESLTFDGSHETNGSFLVISGAGDDHIIGGAKNDSIYGGLGADWMDGGDGADTYIYRTAVESTAAKTDTIVLGVGDKIDLSAMDPSGAFNFVGANAFDGGAFELRLFQSNGHWVAQADVNNDGVADWTINIVSADPVTVNAFSL